jgi:uncharacterized membrane protein
MTSHARTVGKSQRLLLAGLGALLVGVGIYALLAPAAPGLWRQVAALGFVALGVNAGYCAWRAKPSWLSRIGPLP